MVNAEKHRKLKENPFLNWNIEKRTEKIKKQINSLDSFINLEKQCRQELKDFEYFNIK